MREIKIDLQEIMEYRQSYKIVYMREGKIDLKENIVYDQILQDRIYERKKDNIERIFIIWINIIRTCIWKNLLKNIYERSQNRFKRNYEI